jgi:hypothetical protein
MRCSQLRLRIAALLLGVVMQPAALGQNVPVAAAASSQVSFPQLPLKRDSASEVSTLQALGWAVLLSVTAAGGLLLIRRKTGPETASGTRWLRAAAKPGTPKLLGRTLLTQQASVHVIEWDGEELLLGCTPQAVSLLGRRPSNGVRQDREGQA